MARTQAGHSPLEAAIGGRRDGVLKNDSGGKSRPFAAHLEE
jgi:hypothetical protein